MFYDSLHTQTYKQRIQGMLDNYNQSIDRSIVRKGKLTVTKTNSWLCAHVLYEKKTASSYVRFPYCKRELMHVEYYNSPRDFSPQVTL